MMHKWSKTRKKLFKSVEMQEEATKRTMAMYYSMKASQVDALIAAAFARRHENDKLYRDLMQPMAQADKALLLSRCNTLVSHNPDLTGLLPFDRIHRLNKLEGLQTNVRLSVLEVGVYEYTFLYEHLHTIRLQASAEVAALVAADQRGQPAKQPADTVPNADEIRAAIFRSKDKLARYLETDVAQMIARGEDYEAVSGAVCERMKRVAQNDFNRTMYTEDTEVVNEAAAEILEEYAQTYEIVTAGDDQVCWLCRRMDGLQFRFGERKVGVNFPPFHQWCRCSFEIVEDMSL